MIQFKQSEQEYNANIVVTEKKLLPAVLAATVSNGKLIANWLVKNCVEGDVVDAGVLNIVSAVVALDKAGLLDWQVAPIKSPQKKRPDFLQSHEGDRINHAKPDPDRVSEIDLQMAQEKKRREALGDAANAETMAEAVRLVNNHSSFSHSRTQREKTALKAEFDRLVAARIHPTKLLAALQAKQDTFANGDITRPHLGHN